jgi:hypothetical protein
MTTKKSNLLPVMGRETEIPKDNQGRSHGICRWHFEPSLPSLEYDGNYLLYMIFKCTHGIYEGEIISAYEK